jgi:hypothetical protein
MSTLRLLPSFVKAIKSISLLLSTLLISVPAFGATPNPQRVGEVAVESILYATDSGFAMIDTPNDGAVTLYRYSASGVELGRSVINGKSVSGLGLTSLTAEGDYLIAQYPTLDARQAALPNTEFSVWTRTGALVANVSIPEAMPIESRTFAIEGSSLVLRRTNSVVGPLERIDLIDLASGRSTPLTRFSTRSEFHSLAGGVLNVVREEFEPTGMYLYAHAYRLDGVRVTSTKLSSYVPNGSDGLGAFVLPIERDPTVTDTLEVYLEWDFLRTVVSLDRATLKLKSQATPAFKPDRYSSRLLRRGKSLIDDFYQFRPRNFSISELRVDDQRIDLTGPGFRREIRPVFAPNGMAYRSSRTCTEGQFLGAPSFGTICLRYEAPVVYRYDLSGEFIPIATFSTKFGLVRSFAYTVDDSDSQIFVTGNFVRHSVGSEVVIPVKLENIGTAPVFAPSNSSNRDGPRSNYSTNRWTYVAARNALVAPALPIGTFESVGLSTIIAGKYWSFGSISVVYASTPDPTTRLVEFYNTRLGHYFMTFEGSEAQGIDQGGAGAGWVRTGYSFGAWRHAASAPAGAKPVCRLYGNPKLATNGKRLGPNSHFYTIDQKECALVANDPGWILESKEAFYAIPLNPEILNCPSEFTAAARWYNNGFPSKDSNHRYAQQNNSAASNIAALNWTDEGARFCLVDPQ